jgi:hypothetical protein
MKLKQSIKTTGLIAAIAVVLSNVAHSEADQVIISFDHPQSISVSAPLNTVEQASGLGNEIKTTWTITSNNAVGVTFSGKSASLTTINAVDYPVFYKAEVDATGAVLPGRFDHLETKFGADITGFQSFAGADSKWNGGDTPAGTPPSLVTARDATDSPGFKFGSVMPSDAGVFDLNLYSQGIGDASTTQSGDYQISVTATITGEEKGDTTLSAADPRFL